MGNSKLDLPAKLRVRGNARVALPEAAASRRCGWEESGARAALARIVPELAELQYRLYAEQRHALLVVLQAIDGGGKDSTTRHVFAAFNPQGCTVHAFKVPSQEELRHDYLWRVHAHVPPLGEIAVFNRSHYEDVLVPRVDRLVPRRVLALRYRQINDFERMLVECGTRVVKVFLHLSRDEQRRRFEQRVRDRRKQWKFDPADLAKRGQWAAYRAAFGEMLGRCNTGHAPWYVVPADHKWLRDLAVAQVVLAELRALDPRFPRPRFRPAGVRLR